MAKNLKLREISEEFNQLCEVFAISKVGCKSEITNSSNRFENRVQLVINYFLPIFLLIAFNYYLLEKPTAYLEPTRKKQLEKILMRKCQLFLKDINMESSTYKYAESLIKKIAILDCSREQYLKHDFIQFDDNSNHISHKKAFRETKNSKRLAKNMIFKINSAKPEAFHIRLGIEIKKQNNANILLLKDAIIK